MANFLPIKTEAPNERKPDGRSPLRNRILTLIGAPGLAAMGIWHCLAGNEIVRDGQVLTAFLLGLTVFGILGSRIRVGLAFGLVLAILVRLCWCFNSPVFSDDHFRYLHEGQVGLIDLSLPYNQAPATFVGSDRSSWAERVNHPQISSAYLPGLQYLFLGPAAVHRATGYGQAALRLVFVSFELGLLLFFWLRWRRNSTQSDDVGFFLYAFHPLPLLEVYGNSHSDIVGVLFLVVGFTAASTTLLGRASLLALATHIKPFVLAFALLVRREDRVKLLGAAAAIGLLGCVPHLISGSRIWDGFLAYVNNWHAFGVVFDGVLGASNALSMELEPNSIRLVCGVGWAISLFAIATRPGDAWSKTQKIYWAMFAFWLFAPTVHPWYLLWLLPWACLVRNQFGWLFALLWLWHYQVLPDFHAGNGWKEPIWPRLVLLGLGIIMAYFGIFRRTKRSVSG